ncbi:MAG: lipocalin family protein [Bacteroidales bacterium]|nr:lipocalin family protein [Bacteroidales bacterium]
MNIIKKITILLLSAAALVSCAEKEEPIVYLDVNANNIAGSWKLVEWNGAALAPDTYMYVNFVRNDRTFTIYQNIDSFSNVPHVATGAYYIETDVELGAIIRGSYDYDSGDWAHRYVVTELTATGMKWTARDNAAYVQIFERVDTVPVAPVEE